MVMASGIIECADFDLGELMVCSQSWYGEGASGFGTSDVWAFISLLSIEGHIVKWARGVLRCTSQSVLSQAFWLNLYVWGVWNNTALSSLRNIHCCNYSNLQSSCLHLCVLRRRYGVWKVVRNCLYINQHRIMKINTQLHKTAPLIRNATCKVRTIRCT